MVDAHYIVYRNKLMKAGCLSSGFREPEPSMGILVPEIYKGRTFGSMGVREAGWARGRAKQGCGLHQSSLSWIRGDLWSMSRPTDLVPP